MTILPMFLFSLLVPEMIFLITNHLLFYHFVTRIVSYVHSLVRSFGFYDVTSFPATMGTTNDRALLLSFYLCRPVPHSHLVGRFPVSHVSTVICNRIGMQDNNIKFSVKVDISARF